MTFVPDVAYGLNAHPSRQYDAQANETFIAFNARQDPDVSGEITHPLDCDGGSNAVAFTCKDYGADAGDIAPTLRSMGHDGSHANAGGQVAVAFQESQTGCREYESAGTLRSNGPGHDPVGTRIREGMAVRRLTPRECERLQGFPDDYTLVPYRRKAAADGPRYRAIGNSMAVPVMRWIGERIQIVEDMQ
jgi:DNA (cytosine-5)-methyltransferase 1